jgi:hypothetical protein
MIRYLQVRKPRQFSRFVEGDRPQPEWSRLRLPFCAIRKGARLAEDVARRFRFKILIARQLRQSAEDYQKSPPCTIWTITPRLEVTPIWVYPAAVVPCERAAPKEKARCATIVFNDCASMQELRHPLPCAVRQVPRGTKPPRTIA